VTLVRRLLWAFPIALFFLDPSFACTSEEEWQFCSAAMRGAVEGEWTFNITPAGGTPVQAHVRIAQATQGKATTARARPIALVRPAYACGSRTLLASASACVDVTEMPLDVSFIDGDATLSGGPLSGTFKVYGLAFTTGYLELAIGPYHSVVYVTPDGSPFNPQLDPTGPSGTLAVTRP
jgi:hypothetical protein